ncbi:hypothetical protein OIU78_005806 [Salix suchowensis]|nr:hypothetical protein OIU78_005806 [Salix suchowensis]
MLLRECSLTVVISHCSEKIINARDLIAILEDAIRGGYPVVIIAEDTERDAFQQQECKRSKMQLETGLSLGKLGNEVLGHASKVALTKNTTTIIGDGITQEAVNKSGGRIGNLIEAAEQGYEKEELDKRIAKLSGVVAVIQVGDEIKKYEEKEE